MKSEVPSQLMPPCTERNAEAVGEKKRCCQSEKRSKRARDDQLSARPRKLVKGRRGATKRAGELFSSIKRDFDRLGRAIGIAPFRLLDRAGAGRQAGSDAETCKRYSEKKKVGTYVPITSTQARMPPKSPQAGGGVACAPFSFACFWIIGRRSRSVPRIEELNRDAEQGRAC